MILFIVLLLFIVPIIMYTAEYITHIHMVKGEELKYDWCNFKTFLSEFNSRFDSEIAEYDNPRGSVFIRLWDSQNNKFVCKIYLHASIIRFDDDKCMILYPWSYFKYCKWLKQFGEPRRVKGLYNSTK